MRDPPHSYGLVGPESPEKIEKMQRPISGASSRKYCILHSVKIMAAKEFLSGARQYLQKKGRHRCRPASGGRREILL
jgi:hypothetical protein